MTTPPLLVDYSFARPAPETIRQAGILGVGRYLSHDPKKDITLAESHSLFAAGLGVFLIWETAGGEALQGYAYGQQVAREANAKADALGMPTSYPLMPAIDFAASIGQCDPYFEGWASVNKRPLAGYGPRAVIDNMLTSGLIKYGMQSSGWNPQGGVGLAHIVQRLTATKPIGGTDEDAMVRSFPLWMGTVIPPVVASPIPPIFTKPSTPPAPTAPNFPLPSYHYYGEVSNNPACHSGSFSLYDRVGIKRWQQQMYNRGWKGIGAIDGIFGTKCGDVALAFQQQKNLPSKDRKVGIDTWRESWLAPVTAH